MRLTVLKNHVPTHEVLVETPDLSESYEIYIGRSEDCHVLIDDPLISRHHLVLKNEGGKWFCEKLSQLGAVSVNGQSSGSMLLSEGDEIKLGTYTVLVMDLPSAFKPAPVIKEPEPFYVPEEKPRPIDLMEDDLRPAEEMDMTEVLPLKESVQALQELSSDDQEENDNFLDSNHDFNQDSQIEPEESMALDTFDSEASSDELVTFGDQTESMGDDSGDEKTSFFKAFVNYQLVLFGPHAPYDRYQIDADEIFIGRDPKKCQIILDDPEVSTVHAVLRKTKIDVTLEDLNSSNGTILNGERINRAHLSTGDEFVIGSTSFTLETRSDLLEAEAGRLMPVEKGQSIEREEIEEELVDVSDMGDVDFGSDVVKETSILKRLQKDPQYRFRAIIILLVLVGVYLYFDEETPAPAPEVDPKAKAAVVEDKTAKPKVQLSKELEERRNMAYELGVNFFEQNKYFEATKEFQVVIEIDPDYKKVQTYFEQTKEGLKRLEELETQKRAEEERIKTKKLIEELLVKAREAVKEKQASLAENLFGQITEKDPENTEVQQLKMELEAWQKEQEKIALERAAKEAARKAMVDALNPGKTFYLKKEWYKAILKLEEFLRRKGTDEDLVKEGSDMLADAKNQLASDLGPLVGKARSLKEGQDLKAAYEAYLDILKIEPTHTEALNEVDEIKSMLETRAKRIFREAIIAESLSLFNDAREKFQEVQQVSPSDSEYYRKASEKLKNYLE